MTVTVVIARDEHGAPMTREVFAQADRYVIKEGNLDVMIQGSGGLATYPSGNWLGVFMDEYVEVITTAPPEDDSGSSGFDFGGDDSDSSDDTDSSDDSSDDSDSDSSDDS